MSRNSRAFWSFIVLVVSLASQPAVGSVANPKGLGQRLSDFTLTDTDGIPLRLFALRGKADAVVIVFTGTSCPAGNLYIPRIAELAERYESRNVKFLAVNSNASESAEDVRKHAKEFGLGKVRVFKDPGNLAADLCFVDRTCETVLIDRNAVIRYRGAIDDQYGVGTRKDKPGKTFLIDALEEVLAGKSVTVTSSPVEGCPIERIEPKTLSTPSKRIRPVSGEIAKAFEARDERHGKLEVGRVTYSDHVAAIVQAKCRSCHRPGQVAPFSLLSYDDVRRKSAAIAEAVEDRRMPPWHADPRFGHFLNDRSLNAKERATLLAWVEQGAPLGEPSRIPTSGEYPEGWTVGKPDVVFEIPEPYLVPAQGTISYVNVRVPTNFKEDRWVQAAEAVPGNRSVVHHIIVYVEDPKGGGGGGPRGLNHLCGYAPGDMPSKYEPGIAKLVPAGAILRFQIHYTPTGKATTDRSKVGFVFAKEPVKHRAHTLGIVQPRFLIPPGAEHHEVKSTFTFRQETLLLSFMPHMHLRGKDFKYTVTYPDGKSEVLLSVPAYDFGWQSYYTLAKPLVMPKGARIDCVAHFDNSAKNPANPDPSKAVTWGEQTFEEMMIGYVDLAEVSSGKTSVAETVVDPNRDLRQAVGTIRRALGGGAR